MILEMIWFNDVLFLDNAACLLEINSNEDISKS